MEKIMLSGLFGRLKNEKKLCVSQFDGYVSQYKKLKMHKEYCELQSTWNRSIIRHSFKWLPKERRSIVGLGSFIGLLEFAYSHHVNEVVCVDFENFLPTFKPMNVSFHQANLDGDIRHFPNHFFDVCFIVELLEHLLWSPVPLLNWANNHSAILVVSTPDDNEWPPMEDRPWIRHEHFSKIPNATADSNPNPEPMNHCKQYSQSEFIELLDFCGFRILEFQRVGDGGHQMLAICSPIEKNRAR